MITNTFKTLPLIIALLFVIPSVTFAEPVADDQGNASQAVAVVAAPGTSEQGNASITQNVTATSPETTENGNASVGQNLTSGAPVVTDQGNASGVGNTQAPGTTDQGNASNVGTQGPATTDQGNASQTGNPVTPPTNGGGNGSGGSSVSSGGSSSSSSGSRMTIFPTALPIINSLGQCEYITTYMKLGGSYEVSEVTKLQNFLKGIEAIDVAITGVYDEQTANAVKAFQAKYVNDVMLPWGVTTPSGQVYFTTKKKINEIYCKANFALTAEQVAQIEAYKLALANGTLTEGGEVITSTSTTSTNPEVGSATTSSQTAAVADTSFFSKVWDFIKGIFGR